MNPSTAISSPPSNTISILIVDDHPVVRGGLAALLRYERGFQVVAGVGSGEEAVAFCAKSGPPGIVLLDVRMPERDGFETLALLRRSFANLPVLLLAGIPLRHEVQRAQELGANGYLSKSLDVDELLEAIRAVHGGGTAFMVVPARASRELGGLTPRELEVLEYLARGLSREDIAMALEIGAETVKSYVKNILTKLHAADRTEAVARGFAMGLLAV